MTSIMKAVMTAIMTSIMKAIIFVKRFVKVCSYVRKPISCCSHTAQALMTSDSYQLRCSADPPQMMIFIKCIYISKLLDEQTRCLMKHLSFEIMDDMTWPSMNVSVKLTTTLS